MAKLPRLLLAVAVLAASFIVASPALAEPGKGAEVFKLKRECGESTGGGIFCYELQIVSNPTETPSGNQISTLLFKQRVSFTNAEGHECTSGDSSDKAHFVSVFKDGEPQVEGGRFDGESSFVCDGVNTHCTYDAHYHYANGELKFDRLEVGCTPPIS